MRVNFYVEDLLFLRYIGCATVAKTLFRQLNGMPGIEVIWKKWGASADIGHYHTFGPVATWNRRVSKGKKVLTAHSTPRINVGNIAAAKVINRYYPKIYRKFDHIITISEPCHEEVTRMVPDMPVTLIPNGVNRLYFKPNPEMRQAFRDKYGIDDDQDAVLVVAQQTPRKGLYEFFSLAKACPDLKWIWVGGLPYGALSKDYRKIRRMRRKCGENVIFTGYINEIIKAYSGADLFFMPSYAETFGLVILEALSCGLPVVARDIPEFQSIFDDHILYFHDIPDAIATIRDHGARKRCAAGAREYTKEFDIRDIANRHLELYRNLVET